MTEDAEGRLGATDVHLFDTSGMRATSAARAIQLGVLEMKGDNSSFRTDLIPRDTLEEGLLVVLLCFFCFFFKTD